MIAGIQAIMHPFPATCKYPLHGVNECMIAGIQAIVKAGRVFRQYVVTHMTEQEWPGVKVGCSVRTALTKRYATDADQWDVYYKVRSTPEVNGVVEDVWTNAVCADASIDPAAYPVVACANPGAATNPTCTLPQIGQCFGRVRFGKADERTGWTDWKDVWGQFKCSKAFFGHDPYHGTVKECQCDSKDALAMAQINDQASRSATCDAALHLYCTGKRCATCASRRRHLRQIHPYNSCSWWADLFCCGPPCVSQIR